MGTIVASMGLSRFLDQKLTTASIYEYTQLAPLE